MVYEKSTIWARVITNSTQQSSWEAVTQVVMKFSAYYETSMCRTFFTDSNPDKFNSQTDTLIPKN